MVTENQVSDRRGFVRKLVSLAALGGVVGLLFGRTVERVDATADVSCNNLLLDNTSGDTNNTFRVDGFMDTLYRVGASAVGALSGTSLGFRTAPVAGGVGIDRMTINPDGKVGIGTTSPQALLHVSGNDANILMGDSANGITSGVLGGTVGGGGAAGNGNTVTDDYGTVSGGLLNQAGNNDGTTNNAGYATVGGGISNTASGFEATVPGGAFNKAAGDHSFAAGSQAKIDAAHGGAFMWSDQSDFIFNSVAANEFAARATGGVRFVTGIDGSGSPLASRTFVMTNAGNLGVGLSNPARAVHLQGNNAAFRMDRDVNSSAFILVRTAPGNFSTIWKTFYVGVDASGVNNGLFFIGDVANNVGGASTRRLIIDNTGLVGVGRTPTANNLEVEGTASKTAAGSWLANSDMRIKTEISDIDDAVATIRKLHPVRFRYADSYRAKHPSIKDHPYYNFIAQEYREVFPDSVQDDGEGLLQMDSHNTIPYLVRAVQELNEMLSKQNEALIRQNELLSKRIEALEATAAKK